MSGEQRNDGSGTRSVGPAGEAGVRNVNCLETRPGNRTGKLGEVGGRRPWGKKVTTDEEHHNGPESNAAFTWLPKLLWSPTAS